MQCDVHTHMYSLIGPVDYHTPILDWCSVKHHRSGFCVLLREETTLPSFFFFFLNSPRLYSWVLNPDPQFSPWWTAIISDHTMQSPFTLDTQQEAPAMWQFPHSQVFRDCGDNSDNCRAFVHGQHSSLLMYPAVQPSSKVSELGVFMIVNNKGKLATPQRSCC